MSRRLFWASVRDVAILAVLLVLVSLVGCPPAEEAVDDAAEEYLDAAPCIKAA